MRNHNCAFPEDGPRLARIAAEFALKGLSSGALVYGALDPEEIPRFFSFMQGTKRGKSLVERAVMRNQLMVRLPKETYFESGKFDPFLSAKKLSGLHSYSLRGGFSGARIFGTASFASPNSRVPGTDRMFEYEAMANQILRKIPSLHALCLYERGVFGENLIEEVRRIHS